MKSRSERIFSRIGTYHSYYQETGEKLTFKQCMTKIKALIFKYPKIGYLNLFGEFAKTLGPYSGKEELYKIQQKHFKVPGKKYLFVHRRATLTIAQFLLAYPDEEFGKDEPFQTKDLLFIYLLANELINLMEEKNSTSFRSRLSKSLFFSFFRLSTFAFGGNDLAASLYYFEQFNLKMKECNMFEKYKNLVEEKIKIDISKIPSLPTAIKNGNFRGNLFELIENFGVIDLKNCKEKWNTTAQRLDIPQKYAVLQKYPLIKYNGQYYMIDSFQLFDCLIKNIYSCLEENHDGFKGDFGLKIAEPVMIEKLRNLFIGDMSNEIKVSSKKIEFADFGLIKENKIFLFEIKTSVLNDETRFTDNIFHFMKTIDYKFVFKKGIEQQINRLIDIENNYEKFCNMANLPQEKNYTIYPTLIVLMKDFKVIIRIGTSEKNSMRF